MKRTLKNKNTRLLLLSFLMSAGVLLICSKSSPLYPMNDWVDVHCFFTVGRGILDGLVPYRDLYEQKGPVLYFMYALAALISSKTFWGVFLLEVTAFGLFLYYSGKTAGVYLENSRLVYLVVVILAGIIPISPAFAHGGGAEELMLFTLAYGLYSVTNAMHQNRLLTFWESFLNGLFAAMVLLIKFTAMGFYIGLVLFVIFWYLSRNGQWKPLLATAGQFILGAGAIILPVLLYFGIHHAIDDLFTVYFYNNLFLYPQETDGTRLELIIRCLQSTLSYNDSYAPWIYLGAALFALELRTHWRDAVMVLLCFAGLAAGTYWGGRGYTYYGLILAGFAVYGIIAIARLLQVGRFTEVLQRFLRKTPWVPGTVLAMAAVLMLTVCRDSSSNVYLMGESKENMPAYQFAETINQVENPKILNYGFLDGGFYYAADVQPNCRFFCTLNIQAPGMWETQRECINSGQVDFVITRKYTLDRYTVNSSGYTLVDEATFYFEGAEFTYYLYQKNPDT